MRSHTLLLGTAALTLVAAALLAARGEESSVAAGRDDAPRESDGSLASPSKAAPWRLVYASDLAGDLDVYTVSVPGGTPKRVAGVAGRDDFSPTASPDGKTIAFRRNPARSDEGEILLVPAGGGKEINLTRTPAVADWSPAWHPSGRTLAFFSFPSQRGDIWLMRRDGKQKRRLTKDGTLNEYPSFSGDGKRLVFQANRFGQFDLYVISLNGRERRLTANPAQDKWPAWSPDGTWIAFSSDRTGREDIFVIRPDGTGLRNLTRTPELYETHAAWAPDGRLSFTRHGESGPVSLWVVDPAGGAPVQLDTLAQPVFTFDWVDRR
jgi:TolB protein